MCVTSLGWAYEKKYIKGDVSIRDSLKENVNQRGLGSHRPHGTGAGLKLTKCEPLSHLGVVCIVFDFFFNSSQT
jgi:hypothetical protein